MGQCSPAAGGAELWVPSRVPSWVAALLCARRARLQAPAVQGLRLASGEPRRLRGLWRPGVSGLGPGRPEQSSKAGGPAPSPHKEASELSWCAGRHVRSPRLGRGPGETRAMAHGLWREVLGQSEGNPNSAAFQVAVRFGRMQAGLFVSPARCLPGWLAAASPTFARALLCCTGRGCQIWRSWLPTLAGHSCFSPTKTTLRQADSVGAESPSPPVHFQTHWGVPDWHTHNLNLAWRKETAPTAREAAPHRAEPSARILPCGLGLRPGEPRRPLVSALPLAPSRQGVNGLPQQPPRPGQALVCRE